MTYQQIIETPCAVMGTLTYEAYFKLLNASYRQYIMMEAQQADETNMTYYVNRAKEINEIRKHIETLERHEHYKRYFVEMDKRLAA